MVVSVFNFVNVAAFFQYFTQKIIYYTPVKKRLFISALHY